MAKPGATSITQAGSDFESSVDECEYLAIAIDVHGLHGPAFVAFALNNGAKNRAYAYDMYLVGHYANEARAHNDAQAAKKANFVWPSWPQERARLKRKYGSADPEEAARKRNARNARKRNALSARSS